MNKFIHSYLRTAELIISYYRGQEPFPDFIKRYFRQETKFGSRDRKAISKLCFSYLRVGNALPEQIISHQILVGYFLSQNEDNGVVEALKPEWLTSISLPFHEKISIVAKDYPDFNADDVFHFKSELSKAIHKQSITEACLKQSSVFLRIRPGKHAGVVDDLKHAGLSFEMVSEDTISLAAGIKIDTVLNINRDVVIQDISSQKAGMYFPVFENITPVIWDACAASGGKSIMAKDLYTKSTLYVSDVRDSILQQLKSRLNEANVKADKIFQQDLTTPISHVVSKTFPKEGFDLIIADVPCSGSGTWGRNPEWLRFFNEKDLDRFHDRQVKILQNIVPFIKPGGYLLYITCSVFAKENEDVIQAVLAKSAIKLIKASTIESFVEGGDCLFAALLTS